MFPSGPPRLATTLAALTLLLGACGDSPPPSEQGTSSDDPATASATEPAPGTSARTDDVSGTPHDSRTGPDASTEPIPDTSGTPIPDTSGTPSGDPTVLPPDGDIADFIPCEDDVDCPVGFGNCIRTLTFNRVDREGTERIDIADLPGADGRTGVCSLACTSDAGNCASLTTRDNRGTAIPWSCQLVARGASPYTTDFLDPDGGVDLDEMARGRPFAALCRPPFQLEPRMGGRFCRDCQDGSDCPDGLCVSLAERQLHSGPGVCSTPCGDDGECPLGFACETLDDTPVCIPVLDTCSACRDLDRNGFGTGLCDGDEGVSPYDCNDLEPLAYFDPDRPGHPFPDLCSPADFNCNGIPDDSEVIGDATVRITDEDDSSAVAHCTACFDRCGGTAPNASRDCIPDPATPSGFVCTIQCDDPSRFRNCDGDDDTGCETDFSDLADADAELRSQWTHGTDIPETALLYADCDGDGFGDPDLPLLQCPGSEAAEAPLPCDDPAPDAAWVRNNLDCDDSDPERNPGAEERCNGIDNNCDGTVDTPDAITGLGDDCSTGLPMACDEGTRVCRGEEGLACEPRDAQPAGEACTGYDPGCDPDEERSPEALAALIGQGCTADGVLGECRNGTYTCNSNGIRCTPGSPSSSPDLPDRDFLDSSCDGIDGTLTRAIFAAPGGSDSNPGTREQPMASVQAAIDRAAAASPRRDVYLARGEYVSDATIVLADGVGLFGGFDEDGWSRSTVDPDATTLRVRPDSGSLAVGMRGSSITAITHLRAIAITVTPAQVDGASTTGLLCTACNGVRMQDVRIEAAAGRTGQDRSAGTPPSPIDGQAGRDGVCETRAINNTTGNILRGQPGPPSNPACGSPSHRQETRGGKGGDAYFNSNGHGQFSNGVSGMEGGLPPSPGGDGGVRSSTAARNGAPGARGIRSPQQDRSADPVIRDGIPVPEAPDISGSGGSGASGGGGASATGFAIPLGNAMSNCSGASGGNGGCGGVWAPGGGNGGSVYGLVLRDSPAMQLDTVRITTGGGGRGGGGGGGGDGGDGAPGGTSPQSVQLSPGNGGGGGGGAGGNGGDGGHGGHSVGIARDAASTVSTGSVTFTIGPGGAGGTGGTGGNGGTGTVSSGPNNNNGLPGWPGREGFTGRSQNTWVVSF